MEQNWKRISCFNCGRIFNAPPETIEDNFECSNCIGNDIEWSQTD